MKHIHVVSVSSVDSDTGYVSKKMIGAFANANDAKWCLESKQHRYPHLSFEKEIVMYFEYGDLTDPFCDHRLYYNDARGVTHYLMVV